VNKGGNVSKLTVLSAAGDFSKDFTPEAYTEAEETFKELVGSKGYFAYDVDETGQAKITRDFNPNAQEVVLVPRMVGG